MAEPPLISGHSSPSFQEASDTAISPSSSPRRPAHRPLLHGCQEPQRCPHRQPPVRKLTGDNENLDHPGKHLSASITVVGSRSNAPEQITKPNRYKEILRVQITLDPMIHKRDPVEPVPASKNLPRDPLRF
jgi:hypothetical protein